MLEITVTMESGTIHGLSLADWNEVFEELCELNCYCDSVATLDHNGKRFFAIRPYDDKYGNEYEVLNALIELVQGGADVVYTTIA